MGKARPQSLFVVLSFGDLAPYFSSIVLLEKNGKNLENAAHLTSSSEGRPKMKKSSSFSALDTHQNEKEYASHLTSEGLPELKGRVLTCSLDLQKDYVAHLTLPTGSPVVFSGMFCASAISEDLCVVPDFRDHIYIDNQLKGCFLNLRTERCKSFDPPKKDFSYYEQVVSVGGLFYFLTHVCYERGISFKRYDPVKGWETLDPLPGLGFRRQRPPSGSAVFEDNIVLNVEYKFWAYNVVRKTWSRVHFEGCFNILGEAVVIGNTIYALTNMSRGSVVALSIEKNVTKDDQLKLSLLSKIVVPENEIEVGDSMCESRHLVHLGEDNLCLVESCQSFSFYDYQPIQVTYIKLKKEEGEKLMMTVTHTFIYELKIPQQQQFRVMLCFSLPDDKTAALKQGKGPVLEYNPFPEDYVSEEQKVKIQEADDRSVYVRNVPGNANAIQVVEEELEKFGAIKEDGIQVLKNRKEECYAFVEFECVTSKQCAIRASPIIIGGSSAEIMAKKTSKKIKKKKKSDEPGLISGKEKWMESILLGS